MLPRIIIITLIINIHLKKPLIFRKKFCKYVVSLYKSYVIFEEHKQNYISIIY